jgi:hypothetical protein
VFVIALSNDIKYCGEKTAKDLATTYPKTADDLLAAARGPLQAWAAALDAPVVLIGSGTPRDVWPSENSINVRLNNLDTAPNPVKVMAMARARICHNIEKFNTPVAWRFFDQELIQYVAKPVLNVHMADADGHHHKLENYQQALTIRNTVAHALQRARLADNLTSGRSNRITSNVVLHEE